MPLVRARLTIGVIVTAALVAACSRDAKSSAADSTGRDSVAEATPDSGATASATSTASAPSGGASSSAAPLTVDDVDRWQRGMEAELQAVHDAAAKLRDAHSNTDSANAIMGTTDLATRSAGAKAAGVDEDRYQRIRSTFSALVGKLSPIEQEMNVSQMPAAMVAELKKSREQSLAQDTVGLAPALVDTLRSRAAALRKQDLALTAERLKAAGMGH
jgi:hypothetical protein